jgi:hypothetical protein
VSERQKRKRGARKRTALHINRTPPDVATAANNKRKLAGGHRSNATEAIWARDLGEGNCLSANGVPREFHAAASPASHTCSSPSLRGNFVTYSSLSARILGSVASAPDAGRGQRGTSRWHQPAGQLLQRPRPATLCPCAPPLTFLHKQAFSCDSASRAHVVTRSDSRRPAAS